MLLAGQSLEPWYWEAQGASRKTGDVSLILTQPYFGQGREVRERRWLGAPAGSVHPIANRMIDGKREPQPVH